MYKKPKKAYTFVTDICLQAWQTDDWNILSKDKFHPSELVTIGG